MRKKSWNTPFPVLLSGKNDPGTSALLHSMVSANPIPILDPGPSHLPEPEPQPTELPAETESEPAATERYNSSLAQSSPLQPLSVAQQSEPAGDDDKPERLYPIFYSGFRGVGQRGNRRRDHRGGGRVAKQATPRRRYTRGVQSNASNFQVTRPHYR